MDEETKLSDNDNLSMNTNVSNDHNEKDVKYSRFTNSSK